MLTGQNGILNRTQEAKDETGSSSDLEYLRTKAYEAMTNYYATGSNEPETEYVLKNLNSSEIVTDVNTGSINYNGKTYDISDIMGKTSEQKAIESQTNIKLKQITKATATGLVVSDKFGDDDDNTKEGNQFVWVPCKGTAGVTYEKTANAEGKYGLASSWSKYNSYQYYYNDYKDWTDYGGDLNSVNKYGGFYIARYEAGVPSDATFYASEDGATYITEKDANVLNNGYKPVSKKNNQAWTYVYQKTAKALGEKMYEGHTAIKSQLIDSYSWDTTVDWLEKAVSGIGSNSTGYGNYKNSGIKFLDSLYAVHQYQYGSGWIIATAYKKGNGTATGYTELATGVTAIEGSSSQNKMKNIYDMAGNVWEWTTEVGNHSGTETLLSENQVSAATYATFRGGSFAYDGIDDPISYRSGSYSTFDGRDISIGFRVVLYIK